MVLYIFNIYILKLVIKMVEVSLSEEDLVKLANVAKMIKEEGLPAAQNQYKKIDKKLTELPKMKKLTTKVDCVACGNCVLCGVTPAPIEVAIAVGTATFA